MAVGLPEEYGLSATCRKACSPHTASKPSAKRKQSGWRGYLLSRLVDSGIPRPILVSGLLWAVWHFPLQAPHPVQRGGAARHFADLRAGWSFGGRIGLTMILHRWCASPLMVNTGRWLAAALLSRDAEPVPST
ncbi:MAG: CPBP family intramembrane metalloprotease [Myxococcales bacterium]|nr:CPBP family intramembrane metalloprotease [Myxococcales bacterium]